MLDLNTVHQGDCLQLMRQLDDASIDMILCDLPYGSTTCKWDIVIPFEQLWEQYHRIIKPHGAIVLTAAQPFTSKLILSNVKNYRCTWYWEKSKCAAFALCHKQPLRVVEEIVVFGVKPPKYYPQMIPLEKPYTRDFTNNLARSETTFLSKQTHGKREYTHKFPRNLLYASTDGDKRVHPTQKPIKLFEYLIKTYSQEGELILDNCAGSGTTGVAAARTVRNYILMEQDPKYVEIINSRLKKLLDAS